MQLEYNEAMREFAKINQRIDMLFQRVTELETRDRDFHKMIIDYNKKNKAKADEREALETLFKLSCSEHKISIKNAQKRSYNSSGNRSRSTEELVNKRMLVALDLIKAGYTQQKVGTVMRKDHSTIGYYLQRAEKMGVKANG